MTPLKLEEIDLRVMVFDTSELSLLTPIKEPIVRRELVEQLLIELDYPIETLPWDQPVEKTDYWGKFDHVDLEFSFEQLFNSLKELGYSGENLMVGSSFGHLILIQFIKEEK